MSDKGIIYFIENKKTRQLYIGRTKQDFYKRMRQHIYNAYNPNRNDYNKKLYQALREYGDDGNNFQYGILEECDLSEIGHKEIYWIDYFRTYEDAYHYNNTPGGWYDKIYSDYYREGITPPLEQKDFITSYTYEPENDDLRGVISYSEEKEQETVSINNACCSSTAVIILATIILMVLI
jgi:group I intron endonuclease